MFVKKRGLSGPLVQKQLGPQAHAGPCRPLRGRKKGEVRPPCAKGAVCVADWGIVDF